VFCSVSRAAVDVIFQSGVHKAEKVNPSFVGGATSSEHLLGELQRLIHHLNAKCQHRAAGRRRAEEDLTSTCRMFSEPLFLTALCSFPDSSWNKSSDLVSSGSNVVYML